jgi:hypothetical protein
MWPSIRHWLDSVMRENWPLRRNFTQPQVIHYSWERAGLVVVSQPVAWCAEAVRVEALVRLLPSLGRNKSDFTLRIGDGEAFPAEQLRRVEGEDRYRIGFRFAPPPATSVVELLFRGRPMGQLTLPVVSRDDFIRQLRLEMPTLSVRLGGDTVACQTFVASQCRGLLASAVLSSPVGLVPLIDLDLEVEFRCERSGDTQRVPARLTSSQLQSKSALVSVALPRHPRRIGTWTATWLVGSQELVKQKVRGISRKAFERSLRISDTRFVVQQGEKSFRLARLAPPPDGSTRLGPCFLVASSEPGMAGSCRLRVLAHVSGAVQPPVLQEQDVLITDGPAMVAPGTVEPGDLAQVSGFELRTATGSLGLLPLCPVPPAAFTSEGGFRQPPDYSWTAAAEEEMQDRLNRLLGE